MLWVPTARVILQKILEPPHHKISSRQRKQLSMSLNFRKFILFLFKVALRVFPPTQAKGDGSGAGPAGAQLNGGPLSPLLWMPKSAPKTSKMTLGETHDAIEGLSEAYARLLQEHVFPFARQLNQNLHAHPAFQSALKAALDPQQNALRPGIGKIFKALLTYTEESKCRDPLDREWRSLPRWMQSRLEYNLQWHEFQEYTEQMRFLEVVSIRVLAEAFLSAGTCHCADGNMYVTLDFRQFMEVHLRIAIELHASDAAAKLQQKGKEAPSRAQGLFEALCDEKKVRNAQKIWIAFECMQVTIHKLLTDLHLRRTGLDPMDKSFFWCTKRWTDSLHSFFAEMDAYVDPDTDEYGEYDLY